MELKNIVILVKRRDKKAERLLFDLLSPGLMSMCRRYSDDDHTAKDYFQECFIKVFENIHKYDQNKGNFKSWFYRVSTNLILEDKRKKRKIKFVDINESRDVELIENDLDHISKEELISAIRKLPNGYRDILNLFVFEKMSHRDIASLMEIKESTSRSQYVRAKKLLKEILIESIKNIHERQLV